MLGKDSLSRISSAIGKPIFADECTTKQSRKSFARDLIEVDVTEALPKEIITILDPNGRTCVQEVQFDWKPQYCDRCVKIGHTCPPTKDIHATQDPVPDEFEKPKRRTRPRKMVQEWVFRGPEIVDEVIEDLSINKEGQLVQHDP